METIRLIKNRKEEIINLSLDYLPSAFRGDPCSIALFVKESNGSIEIDHYPFKGLQDHSESVFMVIKEHEVPEPLNYGVDSI